MISRKKIWIDLDNTPHVVFFKPIIRTLQERGYEVCLTLRDFYQIEQLATLHGLSFTKIGRHYGKYKLLKVAGLMVRVAQILPTILKESPGIAVSHGSRTQLVAASLLNIPVIMAFDYEFTQWLPFFQPTMVIAPELLKKEIRNKGVKNVAMYQGIKEDVYIPDFRPDPRIIHQLGLDTNKVIVTVRPPADHAHYHVKRSDILFTFVLNYLKEQSSVQIILLPRTEVQKRTLEERWHQQLEEGRFMILDAVVDGLNLIWHSDVVISGGGTIIREAAALGVPAYSIFGGKIGGVDSYLEQTGRLTILHSEADIYNKLRLEQRKRTQDWKQRPRVALEQIVQAIERACNHQQ